MGPEVNDLPIYVLKYTYVVTYTYVVWPSNNINSQPKVGTSTKKYVTYLRVSQVDLVLYALACEGSC